MSLGYVWEKFHLATMTLATSTDRLQERLIDAVSSSLIRLRPEDFTGEMRGEFDNIMHDLTSHPADGDEGTIRATISRLSDDEARSYAQRIVSLYDEVTQQHALARGE